MPPLPSVSGKALIRILEKLGFVVIRTNGSHHRLKHADGRVTTVAVHGNTELPKGTLRKIIREDLDMSLDEFARLVEQYK
jgi:predicted RNA binding protein YcfA (HicA-like mRNA interferase family)